MMSQATLASDHAYRIYQELATRASAFDALLWQTDTTGNILLRPADFSSFASIPVDTLERAVSACIQSPSESVIKWGQTAVRLTGVAEKRGATAKSWFVGAIVSATAGCRSLEQLRALLQWSLEDLIRLDRDATTINQFSQKLEQAYEETQLLFRMARLMNRVQAPVDSLQGMLVQLSSIMPFGWMAMQFSDRKGTLAELRGRQLRAGNVPLPDEQFDVHATEMLNAMDRDTWSGILRPEHSPLAAGTSAEVLSEVIADDGHPIGLFLAGNKGGDDPAISSFETQLADAFADFVGVFHQNAARHMEQQAMFLGTLRALTASIDAKDAYTRGHSERVALLASQMARALGLSDDDVTKYRISGLVHDVGKIGVPEAVLCKPSRLEDHEFAMIQRHPEIGYTILKDIPAMEGMLPGVRHHHEEWGGTGYPDKLAGEAIPLVARVLALADTFDAMSSNRSYRRRLSRDQVFAEFARCAGVQFDPALVPVFLGLDFAEFDRLILEHQESAAPTPAAA